MRLTKNVIDSTATEIKSFMFEGFYTQIILYYRIIERIRGITMSIAENALYSIKINM